MNLKYRMHKYKYRPSRVSTLTIDTFIQSPKVYDAWIALLKAQPVEIKIQFNPTYRVKFRNDIKRFLKAVNEHVYMFNPDRFGNDDISCLFDMLDHCEEQAIEDGDDDYEEYGDFLYSYMMNHQCILNCNCIYQWNRDSHVIKMLQKAIVEKHKTLHFPIITKQNINDILSFIEKLDTKFVSICPKRFTGMNAKVTFIQEFLKLGIIATTAEAFTFQRHMIHIIDKIDHFGVNSVNMAKYCANNGHLDVDLDKFDEKGKFIIKKAIIKKII